MTGPPNGRVPPLGERRDINAHQGDPVPAGSGTEDSRTIRDLTDLPHWAALAAWVEADR